MQKTTILIVILFTTNSVFAQNKQVWLQVDASKEIGEMTPIYAYFGYDEPNYTYMDHGKKLLTEIAELSPVPVYVRTHNLLTSQEGELDLKWGYTNVYTEDKQGNPVYDWTILDKILSTYVERGMRPLVELGFMPKALSTHPEPYEHAWSKNGEFWTGWTYPPTDYNKWAELIYQLVIHAKEEYGSNVIETWLWQVWNEPDIGYWSGTFDEYCMLYDYAVDAVKRACPDCIVGGPHTTGPGGESGNKFLYGFLEHCLRGSNYVNGKTGSPLEYISFHAKGQPEIVNGHIRMNMGAQLNDLAKGFEAVNSFPELKELPIIIGECDPEGCAACSWKRDPKYGYRNGTVYPSYTASSFAKIYELKDQYDVNLVGALSWSFEFENQEWFAGFRELATNGVDKPVLNVFRMFGMMSGNRLEVSGNPYSADEVIANGVLEEPDINALAARAHNSISIMVWNYHDNDILGEVNDVSIHLKGLKDKRLLMHHYRVDQEFSNSFEKWKEFGEPQAVTGEQFKQIEQAGQLELYTSPTWIKPVNGETDIQFSMPRQAVSLVKLEW